MRLGIPNVTGTQEPQEWARELRALGCGCVVLPVGADDSLHKVREYARCAREQGLNIAEVWSWCNLVAPDEQERRNAIETCKHRLRLADEIGAECCVNVAGSAGAIWKGAYAENLSREMWERTVRSIQEILDAVKPTHTYYTVEAMPYMFPTGPQEYHQLLDAVARDRFAVHMDVCNWISSPQRFFRNPDFMEQCFELLGPYIRSCHLKDVKLRQALVCQLEEVPCGQGGMDLERYLALAERYKPDMPMILEHLQDSAAYIKSVHYLKKRFQGKFKL